jgi:hypothetical protein
MLFEILFAVLLIAFIGIIASGYVSLGKGTRLLNNITNNYYNNISVTGINGTAAKVKADKIDVTAVKIKQNVPSPPNVDKMLSSETVDYNEPSRSQQSNRITPNTKVKDANDKPSETEGNHYIKKIIHENNGIHKSNDSSIENKQKIADSGNDQNNSDSNATENDSISNNNQNIIPLENGDVSKYLREVLDASLEIVKEYDPCILDKFEKIIENGSKTHINFVLDKDFKITGLSKIRIDDLKCGVDDQKLSLKVNTDLVLLNVQGVGQYKLEGKANVLPLVILPLRGNGKATFEVKQLKAKGELTAIYNINKFTIDTLQVKFDLDNVNFLFENLLDNNLSKFVNKLLNMKAKPLIYEGLFENNKRMKELKQGLKDFIEKQINENNELTKLLRSSDENLNPIPIHDGIGNGTGMGLGLKF